MSSRASVFSLAIGLTVTGWAAGVATANAATDPGVRPGALGVGNPVPGLTANQTELFFAGQASFKQLEGVTDGLGPRFNLDSCVGCHSFPTHGGSSPATNPQATVATAFGAKNILPTFITATGPIREARFKFTPSGARDGGVHSLFVVSGRVDSEGSAANCTAVQENFDAQFQHNNVSLRIPTATYGLGLVENITDRTLVANLAANSAQKAQLGIAGHLNTDANDGRVTRFGWKAQNVSLLMFSGEAYNVEEGITNELFQTERDENPTCQFAPVSNDFTEQNGTGTVDSILSDIEHFALYMRLLGAPIPSTTIPGGAASISRGQQTFTSVGCAMCHTPSLTTAGVTSVAALGNQTAVLYSDLAVHKMGPNLADNIIQGSAGPDEFRTALLWGIGQRIFFLHDGRTSNLMEAIQDHASNGNSQFASSEANSVISNFNRLSDSAQQDVLNFLRSL